MSSLRFAHFSLFFPYEVFQGPSWTFAASLRFFPEEY